MVSFDPNILAIRATEGDQPHLIGSKCTLCSSIFFPQQTLCTECFADDALEPYPLSTRGKIYAFTIVERESLAPKGFQVPYVYGYIELPERVRVLSKIIGWAPETLKLDAPVELVLESLREISDGEKVIGFRFRIT